MKILLVALIVCTSLNAIASEKNQIDSLERAIKSTKSDQKKINLLDRLNIIYSNNESDSLLPRANQLLELTVKYKDLCGQSDAHFYLGNFYYKNSDVEEALEEYGLSLALRKKHCSKEEVASTYLQLGNVQNMSGDYGSASTSYHKSLAYYEKHKSYYDISKIYLNLGMSESSRENYTKATDYFNQSINLYAITHDTLTLGNAYNNIGGVYQVREIYDTALVYFQKSMDIYRKVDHKSGLAHGYNNIGIIHYYAGHEDSCMIYFKKSLGIRLELGEKRNISQSYNNIGELYMLQKDYLTALKYADTAMIYAKDAGVQEEVSDSYLIYYEIYFEMGDYYNASVNLKLHYDMRNSLLSERNERIMREKDTKYKTVKKEKELEAKNRILLAQDSAIERQNIIIGASIAGGILMALLLIVVIQKNKVARKQSAIIEEQKSIVIERQREIISSINYAKRIQDAILKSEEHETKHLPEHFVIYKPKDIVSGDFYWVQEKENFLYLAVADCTGHGVPGAFLTMLGSSFLNEINAVERNLTPAEILDKLRTKFVKELSQSDEQGENADGMDISLIRLDLVSNELSWAGANNPLWIRRHASQELEIIKPDKEPIAHSRVMTPFSNHQVQLHAGDSIYLFSDGYADQFGGPRGKKFMAKALKELILSIQDKTIAEQKLILDDSFLAWKGELNQIDDVCLVGMRV